MAYGAIDAGSSSFVENHCQNVRLPDARELIRVGYAIFYPSKSKHYYSTTTYSYWQCTQCGSLWEKVEAADAYGHAIRWNKGYFITPTVEEVAT